MRYKAPDPNVPGNFTMASSDLAKYSQELMANREVHTLPHYEKYASPARR